MSAGSSSEPYARFDEAQDAAAANGLPAYADWRAALERQYTAMPLWYWNTVTRRRNYAAYIQSCLDWQRHQARINQRNAAFHSRFGRLVD